MRWADRHRKLWRVDFKPVQEHRAAQGRCLLNPPLTCRSNTRLVYTPGAVLVLPFWTALCRVLMWFITFTRSSKRQGRCNLFLLSHPLARYHGTCTQMTNLLAGNQATAENRPSELLGGWMGKCSQDQSCGRQDSQLPKQCSDRSIGRLSVLNGIGLGAGRVALLWSGLGWVGLDWVGVGWIRLTSVLWG